MLFGQEVLIFHLHKPLASYDNAGRPLGEYTETDTIRAVVTRHTEAEEDTGGFPRETRTLLLSGRAPVARGDILTRNGTRLRVRAVRDPGMLGIVTEAECEVC